MDSYVNISEVITYIILNCNINTESVTLIFYIYMLEEVFMSTICSLDWTVNQKKIANLISKLNFYKLIPYPMDNCLSGRRRPARQTPEKDVLCCRKLAGP